MFSALIIVYISSIISFLKKIANQHFHQYFSLENYLFCLTLVTFNSGTVCGFGGQVSLGAKDLAEEIDKINNKTDANLIIVNFIPVPCQAMNVLIFKSYWHLYTYYLPT